MVQVFSLCAALALYRSQSNGSVLWSAVAVSLRGRWHAWRGIDRPRCFS